MCVAQTEQTGVVVNRTSECTLLVSEKFGFNEALRKLRKINGDKGLGKVGRKAAAPGIERDEARSADRGGGGTLASAGFTK